MTRLVLWTLRAVKDEARRTEALQSLLARTKSLSWKAELVRLAQRNQEDTPLINEEIAKSMLEDLRTQVLASTPERFTTEREPYWVARMAHDHATDTFDPRLRSFLEHPGFFRAMLASLVTESRSRPIDSVAVTTKPSLPWKLLKKVAGGEEELRELLRAAVEAGPALESDERMATALQVAADVLAGRSQMIGPEERGLRDADDDDECHSPSSG